MSLHQRISGLDSISPNIPSLKYGREMEPRALQRFIEVMKPNHKNLKVTQCGLFLDSQFKFIGACPDGIVQCECCEDAVLEIKCPYSINHLSPVDADVD